MLTHNGNSHFHAYKSNHCDLFILHKTTCLLIFAGIYSISYELLILHSELGLLLCCFKPEQLQEPQRVKTEIKVRKTY